jgi:protease IV
MSWLGNLTESAGIGAGNLLTWWQRRAGQGNVLEVNLAGRIVEDVSTSGLIQRFIATPLLSMRELLASIDYAAEDPNIRALFLRIAEHDLGWGRAEELFEAITKFRAAGKFALAFLEAPENVDTFIAAACDRVAAPPGIPIYLTGLLSEVMYFKGILDKLEIQPELFQAGKYKSAVEPYMRAGMSKEHRESVEAVLDGIYERWVAALAAGRGVDAARASAWIDEGPWQAEEAKDAGLLDALIYEDQVDDYLEKWLGLVPRRIGLDRYLKLFGPRATVGDPWRKAQGLALITASGTIHGGENHYYGAGDGSIGADTMRRALNAVREDDRISAAVIRVDSPGGSAVHSDLIWREVERLRAEKPVVVSMADVAASGGYYIAMPAHHIVAASATLTGSIGVIGGKINFKGLYNKIGIKKEQVRRGRHADIGTDYGQLTPELRKKMQGEMQAVYRIFVDKAAAGRKQEPERLERSAQGRVWTGAQAKELGLVDEIGSLLTAIARAKERAGIPASRRLPLFSLPRPRKFALPGIPFSLPIPGGSARALTNLLRYQPLADTNLLALMPFMMKIK